MRMRNGILLLGIVNGALYSALLPLWEGFDEAFHYGYVETLWRSRRLPVLGRTMVPEDVFRSFELAPLSHVVNRTIPEAITFEAWFALPEVGKEQRRRELDLLRPGPESSSRADYEVHHPPLAYLLLAPVDWLISRAPVTLRVLVLRLFCAAGSIVLLYFGAMALCRALAVPEPFANAALFTIFCSEMLYATIAHISNDWLAVGLSACFLAALAGVVIKPDRRSALSTSAYLTAGLLTKAYFLAFALLAIAVTATLLWHHRIRVKTVIVCTLLAAGVAGPWYVRNIVLYGNVSGTQEEFDGIGIRQALGAAPRINWIATSGYLARASIWTGNNSFTSFSRSTLNIVLALLAVALIAWGWRRRLIQPAERTVFAAIVLFSIAVGYASCAMFVHTHGEAAGASPWYTQVLLAPVMALAYLGMSRSRGAGRILATCTTVLWTWVMLATWTVKLFPMYSGGSTAPMRLPALWNWYLHDSAEHTRNLSLLALAPGSVLNAGLLLALGLTIVLSAAVVRGVNSSK